MRTRWKQLIPALLTICASFAASSQAFAAGDAGQLSWQKMRFEETLREKIRKAISPVVAQDRAVITATIQLKETALPARGGETGNVFLEKIDVDGGTLALDFDEADVIENIKTISISVLYDSALGAAKQPLIEQIVRGVTGGLGDPNPEIKIEAAALSTESNEPPWGFKRWLVEFKSTIGILVGVIFIALLMGIPGIWMVNEFRKLQSRRIQLLETENTRKQAEAAEQKSGSDPLPELTDPQKTSGTGVAGTVVTAAPATVAIPDNAESGVEKFRQLLKDSPEQAAQIARQWIKAPSGLSADALVYLPQILGKEDLTAIFGHLSLQDRREWKRLMKSPLSRPDATEIDRYIGIQTVDTMLVPPRDQETEIRALAAELSTAECAQLASDDPEMGAALINLLPTGQVSRIMALLPAEAVNRLSAEGLRMSDATVLTKLTGLQRAITDVRRYASKEKKAPFYYEAIDLLHQLSPDRQESLFNAMAEAEEYALLESSAKRFLPSEIVLKLPDELLRSCLGRLPSTTKAELIVSLEEAGRRRLLESLGSTGMKLRDLVELDVQAIEADDLRAKRVKKKKDALWQQFVENVRTTILINEAAADLASTALNQWLFEKTQGRFGERANDQNAA